MGQGPERWMLGVESDRQRSSASSVTKSFEMSISYSQKTQHQYLEGEGCVARGRACQMRRALVGRAFRVR